MGGTIALLAGAGGSCSGGSYSSIWSSPFFPCSGEKFVERNIYLFGFGRVKLKKRMNAVHVRDQKHELTPPRNRKYPCDNGNKKVTAFPPRDIVYKQDNQLFGLRDKPITQQDALSKSKGS
ncbi:hypothetical protein GQ457_18G011110 [Hibiscus cannabinus]